MAVGWTLADQGKGDKKINLGFNKPLDFLGMLSFVLSHVLYLLTNTNGSI